MTAKDDPANNELGNIAPPASFTHSLGFVEGDGAAFDEGTFSSSILNLPSVASAHSRSEANAVGAFTVSVDLASAFYTLQGKLIAIEELVNAISSHDRFGVGGNLLPDAENAPLSQGEWSQIREHLAVLRGQQIVPRNGVDEAANSASAVKSLGEKLGDFLARHGDEFASQFANAAGKSLGNAVIWAPLAYTGYQSLSSLSHQLADISQSVFSWLHLLGH